MPAWVRVLLTVAATLALATWGFLELHVHVRLNFIESLYSAVKLYTLDLGPASGSAPGPDWQIWLAFVAAAALVLRGVVALGRDRVRRAAIGHLLSGHVVICGAGVHGTELARRLSLDHDVVLVDVDPVSPGMQELRGPHEWRLIGDAVSARTLRAAGVTRAHWVIAVTGNDFINSQIASGVRSLQDKRDRVHVVVQIEDPALARFLEEDDEVGGDDGKARPVVSPFSANAIAADVLLDGARVRVAEADDAPLVAMRAGASPNLLLVGDHPLLDAIVLALLRRWRVRVMREAELDSKRVRPPIHISVYGPEAERRVARLREAWRPEPEVLALEGRDSPPAGQPLTEIDDWLRTRGRGEHAIVASQDELAGIALTLTVARALGDRARMTRVTTQFENALDSYVEERTKHSYSLASTDVRSIAELGARPERMREASGADRLIEVLERDPARQPPPATGPDPVRPHRELDPVARAQLVFNPKAFRIRSDTTWRVRRSEWPLLKALLDASPELEPVPLSAILRAGLRIDLDTAPGLLEAATRLSRNGDPAALTAWCEYLRHAEADRFGQAVTEAREHSPVRAVRELLSLVRGERSAGSPPSALAGAEHVTIFAGAAGSMSGVTRREIERLLERALDLHDGVLLSGGTAVGMPGIVGRLARRRKLALIGYVPAGEGDAELYHTLRPTPGSDDFSVLEPLAMWSDIIASGFDPRQVALVVCPGKEITLQEISLARAMGARIGWLDPAGEAEAPLDDQLPLGAAGIAELPPDSMTIRAFVAPTTLSDPPRDSVARYIHNDYRRRQRRRKSYGDPALAAWRELPETLRASNLAQADDIPNKLALIRKRAVPDGEPLSLTDEQVEQLAEVEHGRWNAERLRAGWRVGPRQVGRSTSPDLVPWAELPEATRDYDREAVRTIGPALAEAGWGVADA